MTKRYENLEKAMCNELEKLDKKYGGDIAEMSVPDAEKADMLYHALKSAATYHAMKDAEEEDADWGEDSRSGRGRSYARYRSPRTGRYVSRDMGDYSGRYPGEYGYSGTYPMDYITPYWDRR